LQIKWNFLRYSTVKNLLLDEDPKLFLQGVPN